MCLYETLAVASEDMLTAARKTRYVLKIIAYFTLNRILSFSLVTHTLYRAYARIEAIYCPNLYNQCG